jgi:hypothetical protein
MDEEGSAVRGVSRVAADLDPLLGAAAAAGSEEAPPSPRGLKRKRGAFDGTDQRAAADDPTELPRHGPRGGALAHGHRQNERLHPAAIADAFHGGPCKEWQPSGMTARLDPRRQAMQVHGLRRYQAVEVPLAIGGAEDAFVAFHYSDRWDEPAWGMRMPAHTAEASATPRRSDDAGAAAQQNAEHLHAVVRACCALGKRLVAVSRATPRGGPSTDDGPTQSVRAHGEAVLAAVAPLMRIPTSRVCSCVAAIVAATLVDMLTMVCVSVGMLVAAVSPAATGSTVLPRNSVAHAHRVFGANNTVRVARLQVQARAVEGCVDAIFPLMSRAATRTRDDVASASAVRDVARRVASLTERVCVNRAERAASPMGVAPGVLSVAGCTASQAGVAEHRPRCSDGFCWFALLRA